MFTIVYRPGLLTRDLFFVRLHIVNSVTGGCVRGDDRGVGVKTT